jgi:ATP-dependent RNA helicase DeaD
MENFTKLGLGTGLTDVLKRLNFKEPTEIQEKAIPVALAGKDIIGGSATGSGKTLAFASPIIENLISNKGVQAIVLTPTRELAEQVANSIKEFSANRKLNVLAVYGGVKIEPQMKKLFTTDVLVGTPGRILDHLKRRTLRLDKIKFLVLDEVDRMFDMGFSKDVERILGECNADRQTMMFSATISSDIDHLAQKYTKNPVEIAVKSHVDPTKLKQVYYDVPDNKKFSLLVNLLEKEKADLVMVFCSTRRNADCIADNLIKLRLKANVIHGGIEQNKRIRVLEDFHKKGLGIMVCTDVAARGLDIKGVSHVYNYDVPENSKDYIHRIGRTARAGENGKAITILASRDYEKFGTIIQSKEITILPQELPKLETMRIRMDYGRDNRFGGNSRGRDSGRGPQGRDSRGPRRDFDRREGSNSNRGPRRDSKNQSYGNRQSSYGRDSERNFSRGNTRDGPRNSNRGPRNYDRRENSSQDQKRDSSQDQRRDNRPQSYGRPNTRRPINNKRRY